MLRNPANDNQPGPCWAKIEHRKVETEATVERKHQDAIKMQLISAWGRVIHA